MKSNKYELSGYYVDDVIRKPIPSIKYPTNIGILMSLDIIKDKKYGVIILTNKSAEDEVDPESLTLYFEQGNYLLMLLDYDDEGYIDVRTLYNPAAPHGVMQNILGEPYGATTIVQDLDVVKRCFIEFNKTGNVSKELMT